MSIVEWGFKEGWIKTPKKAGSELQENGSGFVLEADIGQIKTTHTPSARARTENGFLLEADIGHMGESHNVPINGFVEVFHFPCSYVPSPSYS